MIEQAPSAHVFDTDRVLRILSAYCAPLACRWGNLWAFSTAKLESRGKVMKGIVRHQSSARPEQFGASKVKKHRKKRGGPDSKPNKRYANTPDFYMVKAHRNNQMRTVLANMTI